MYTDNLMFMMFMQAMHNVLELCGYSSTVHYVRWPSTNSVAVCQFLLSACQYTHLQVSSTANR